MKKVNIQELFPSVYQSDAYIEVEGEVEAAFASVQNCPLGSFEKVYSPEVLL